MIDSRGHRKNKKGGILVQLLLVNSGYLYVNSILVLEKVTPPKRGYFFI